jgi:hypothetical protein
MGQPVSAGAGDLVAVVLLGKGEGFGGGRVQEHCLLLTARTPAGISPRRVTIQAARRG